MPLPDSALDQLFRTARTFNAFRDEPVTDVTLHALYDLLKWAPTTMNSNPARFVFLRSAEAKAKLGPALSPGNHDKTMKAPCTAIIAFDLEFYEKLPVLYPYVDSRAAFAGKPEVIKTAAMRNGSLQGAYFILAARALGLSCGPMSGFDNAKVDAAFFEGSSWRSNFLCNIGIGDPTGLRPRGPRLAFDEACRIE